MTTPFLIYVWAVLAVCTCLYVWAKWNGFLALLLAIGWLMVAVAGGLIV